MTSDGRAQLRKRSMKSEKKELASVSPRPRKELIGGAAHVGAIQAVTSSNGAKTDPIAPATVFKFGHPSDTQT